ncbi:unnamed protein product [Alopecurus aequalis]
MEEVWPLPAIEDVEDTGSEWLLQLMEKQTDMVNAMTIMTFWRAWHGRNEVVHHKPAPSIEASRRFLCSYLESLISIKQNPQADVIKGKGVVDLSGLGVQRKLQSGSRTEDRQECKWRAPSPGWVKLNVDGAFKEEIGNGGAGMVLRDVEGKIIFSACRHLFACGSALEAELGAMMEGIALAQERTSLPIVVESDSSEAVRLVNQSEEDRSAMALLVQEIKRLLLGSHRASVVLIKREQNQVANALASAGRTMIRTQVWPHSVPDNILALCQRDCSGMV